jgi:VWFA-related protein
LLGGPKDSSTDRPEDSYLHFAGLGAGQPLDKAGHFIPGLSAKHFQVLVDGEPVELASFDVVTEDSPKSHPESEVEPPLPANTYRNIPGTSASQSNLVILLVDYLNTRMVDRMGLRDALLKFFSAGLRPDQEIAVYGLTRSLVLLQPFTRDSASLTAVAKSILKQKGQPPDPVVGRPLYEPALEGPPTKEGIDAVAEYFTLLNARREYNLDQFHRANETLAAFRELAESLGGIAGKKSVVWLTGDASPLNPSMMYRILIQDKSVETNGVSSWETAKTYEALNSAAVSVFPVDVRGIGNSGMRNAGETQTHYEFELSVRGTQPGDMSPYSGINDMRESEAANSLLAMDSVAGETGATVLAGSNRVENLLDRAHKLWANYYVLAFVPERPANEKAATYHRIQVKLDQPGAHVLARRGFLTRPEAMLSSETEIQRDIAEAVTSPIDLTSLSLQLTLGETRDEGGTRHLPLTLTISNAALGTVSEKGAPCDLSIAILVRDQHDRLLTNEGKRVRAMVPTGELAHVAGKGLRYDSEFQAPAGNFFFGRVIVRDNLSGRTGTISLTLPSTSPST